jgi:hypothetical protein
MADRETARALAVHGGLLLSVLCLGVAGGAWLATRSDASAGPVLARTADLPASPPAGRARGEVNAPQRPPGVEHAGAQELHWPSDSALDGAWYTPASGAEPVDSAPARPASVERLAEPAAVVGLGDPAKDSARSTALESRGERDDVGAVDPERAAGALHVADASSVQTVVYDVGVPGARSLGASVQGRWAWLGTCTELKLEISQLPGGPAGGVRGVGWGAPRERVGWVVPAAGCSLASRRIGQQVAALSVPADAPRSVRELRGIGSAPCGSGAACAWYVGIGRSGRAVAVLARGATDYWIRLDAGS